MKTRILRPGDPGYPAALDNLSLSAARPRRGPTLYVRGTLPDAPGLAMVGTRSSNPQSEAFATELAKVAAAAGCSIWSGGARGIDTACHRSALDAGAPTVAVVTGGLDQHAYPAENAALFEGIVEAGGALISLQPDRTPRTRYQFPQRNHVIAAMSFATVVVQRGRVSGAAYTSAAARRLGRDVLAVPEAPWSEPGAGFALELDKGALVLTSAAELARYLERQLARIRAGTQLSLPAIAAAPPRGGSRRAPPGPAVSPEGLDERARAVLAVMSATAQHTDAVCTRTGLPYPAVAGALLTLSLGGFVLEAPPGHFRLPP